MNLSEPAVQSNSAKSEAGRERLLSCRGEPLFFADWQRVLMIHFEVDAEALQRNVPFQLDLREGRAFVSVVAFTMHGMRPRIGGKLAAWLCRPIATHDFLNVRTYVRHGGEAGIHFLAEWLSNRLAVRLGPRTFGLPYRFGRIDYEHQWQRGQVRGRVEDRRTSAVIAYRARLTPGGPIRFVPCESGSLDEWLMERYAAFNCVTHRRRFFRVWHSPWPQCQADATLSDISLLRQHWPCFSRACMIGANFSPGLREVWMGRPHCC